VEALRWQIQLEGQRPAYTYLRSGSEVEESLSWHELGLGVSAVACTLRDRGIQGQCALLAYPAGLDFITAFLGCLAAGVIAVPVILPRNDRSAQNLLRVAADTSAPILLTSTKIDPRTRSFLSSERADGLDVLETDRLLLTGPLECEPIDSNTIAYLQYTSGSTSSPRGVVIRHGNVMANLAAIHYAVQAPRNTCHVIWLPHYHDMGLLNLLYALLTGSHGVILSPTQAMQDPASWLRAISRFRANLSGGPNFAYHLCASRICPEVRAGLDLSCWHFAFCGAEPVRRATLEAFAKVFGGCGFTPDRFYSCYGLAESTLAVTLVRPPCPPRFLPVSVRGLQAGRIEPPRPQHPEDVLDLVACGQPSPGHRAVIVDPQTRTLRSELQMGEIWVSGPSVSSGYWRQPELSRDTFAHYLASGEGPFLRTGDLGILHEGQLYVTGRVKDLIIIRGRNLHPQDIEEIVQSSHPAFRPFGTAAFALDDGQEEKLVIVQEVEWSRRHDLPVDEVVASVRHELALRHEISPSVLVLVAPNEVPKTSSGKVQRSLCRERYRNKELKILAEWIAPPSASLLETPAIGATVSSSAMVWSDDPAANRQAIHDELLRWLRQEKGGSLPEAAASLSLAQLGLDSVALVRLHASLEAWLGRTLPVTLLLDCATFDKLVDRLVQVCLGGEPDAPQTAPGGRGDAVREILETLENLSEDEVGQRLARWHGQAESLS